jgi:hypothetical protein
VSGKGLLFLRQDFNGFAVPGLFGPRLCSGVAHDREATELVSGASVELHDGDCCSLVVVGAFVELFDGGCRSLFVVVGAVFSLDVETSITLAIPK